jgi:hypothetical protein
MRNPPARPGMAGVPWFGLGLLLWLEVGLGLGLELSSAVGSVFDDGPPAARAGGVPCRDRWNAFILASILSDRPPLPGGGTPRTLDICAVEAFGLRALFSRPRGVEDAVMKALGGVETERREGKRGVFVGSSSDGLDGDSC